MTLSPQITGIVRGKNCSRCAILRGSSEQGICRRGTRWSADECSAGNRYLRAARGRWRWAGSPGRDLEILGQTELEGRSYSATLVAAVAELLAGQGIGLKDLGGIVAVNGPGSFTGVRVGLSAVKGLAEPAQIPVVAVSRLQVLRRKSGVPSAALSTPTAMRCICALEDCGQAA